MSGFINIPVSDTKKRVVIIGGGFGGMKMAKKFDSHLFQIVLIDKNNYHTFQPLLYQVAAAGVEPSAISFPFRNMFKSRPDFYFRMCTVDSVDSESNTVVTSVGSLNYDYLIVATGCDTNFFGNDKLADKCLTLKSVSEALDNRNHIIASFEEALNSNSQKEREQKMCFVVVGGGATGVEMAGALAEMRNTILTKDYPDLDSSLMRIILVDASSRPLNAFSEQTSAEVKLFLEEMGTEMMFNCSAKDYNDGKLTLSDDTVIYTDNVFWVAGVKANSIAGLKSECYGHNNRLLVDNFNRVKGYENIFSIGDTSLMINDAYPRGYPQVVQPAIQQAELCVKNIEREMNGIPMKEFVYSNRGSMATVGRKKAVVELKHIRFGGFIAWLMWLFVHLMSIVGVKNRLFIFFDWMWSYMFYDQSLRLLIRPYIKNKK